MLRKDLKYSGDGHRKAVEKLAAHLSSRNYRVRIKAAIYMLKEEVKRSMG